MSKSPEEILATRVAATGGAKPFGEFTADDVAARARELKDTSAAGGPTVRVGAVGRAWSELEHVMREAGADRVADLDPAAVAERAEKLWIVPPGGSLL